MKFVLKKWSHLLLFISFALVFSALLYLIFIPEAVKVDTVIVTRDTFRNIIKSDGFLRSKEKFIVSAFSDGDIKRVSLRVGDEVKVGEKVAELIRDVTYLPVVSPINGVVSRVYRESAGPIRRGEPIIELVDPYNLELVIELLTTDATQVNIGDKVYGTGWGGDFPIVGKVIRISKAGFIKTSALGVEEEKTEIIADLSQTSPEISKKLGSHFHIDAIIEIELIPNALVVPIGALFRSGTDWAVYKVVDSSAKETKIKIKSKGYENALIDSGINEGESVIMFPGDLVKDGTKIRK
jgi:HlyD family secretion protein